ncbi:MXAN_5187 C-terminal domain-containing protein [Nannocystaceae bacterium ST9]
MAAPGDNKRVTMATLDELEEAIEMLKVAFERYFNGVDRIPPTRDHDDVKRSVRTLLTIRGGPTAVRFRLQNLKARLVTYEHYWTRILLQIEKGTFKRVVAESERRQMQAERQRIEAQVAAEAQAAAAAAEAKPAGESESEDAPARSSQSGRYRIPVARPPSPPSSPSSRASLPSGVDASEARELFKQFVAAKKAAGEPTAGLTYGKLVDKLSRELPDLRAKHGEDIRFEVATVNGKVRLRARSRGERGQKAS